MFENCTIQIEWSTPLEKIDELESCMNEWLSTEENRWFEPATSIVLQHIDFQRYLEITIGCLHNGYRFPLSYSTAFYSSNFISTWQDWSLRCARKTAFHAAVQYYSRQLGIVGYESPMPIVYGDAETMTYAPPSPGLDEGEMGAYDGVDAGASREHLATAPMKPTLGFLPPVATRTGVNIRQRKSKSRKAILRGMDG